FFEQQADIALKSRAIDSCGQIEIIPLILFFCFRISLDVIIVLRNKDHFARGKVIEEAVQKKGLTRPAASGDADNERGVSLTHWGHRMQFQPGSADPKHR